MLPAVNVLEAAAERSFSRGRFAVTSMRDRLSRALVFK